MCHESLYERKATSETEQQGTATEMIRRYKVKDEHILQISTTSTRVIHVSFRAIFCVYSTSHLTTARLTAI